jgi:hypothetical protein
LGSVVLSAGATFSTNLQKGLYTCRKHDAPQPRYRLWSTVRFSVIISEPSPPQQKKTNINKSSRLPPIRHLGTFYFHIERKKKKYMILLLQSNIMAIQVNLTMCLLWAVLRYMDVKILWNIPQWEQWVFSLFDCISNTVQWRSINNHQHNQSFHQAINVDFCFGYNVPTFSTNLQKGLYTCRKHDAPQPRYRLWSTVRFSVIISFFYSHKYINDTTCINIFYKKRKRSSDHEISCVDLFYLLQ